MPSTSSPAARSATDFQKKLDLRIDKVFKLEGNNQVTVYADIYNLFNAPVRDRLLGERNSALFGTPLAIVAPRQLIWRRAGASSLQSVSWMYAVRVARAAGRP